MQNNLPFPPIFLEKKKRDHLDLSSLEVKFFMHLLQLFFFGFGNYFFRFGIWEKAILKN